MAEYSKICSEILDGFLYLSGVEVASNLEILKENKITHVINCAAEIIDVEFQDSGIKYLKLNLVDSSSQVKFLTVRV